MNQIALRSIPINNNQIVRPGPMIRFLRSNGYQKILSYYFVQLFFDGKYQIYIY